MKLSKRFGWFGMTALVFLAGLAVQIVLSMVVMIPIGIMEGMKMAQQGITDPAAIDQMSQGLMEQVSFILVFVMHVGLIVVFGLWYRLGCGKPSLKKMDKNQIFSVKGIMIIVLLSIGLNVFVNFAMSLLVPVIPESIWGAYEALMEQAAFGENIWTTLAAVFLAPFGEELMFRGVTFFYAKKMTANMSNAKVAFWIANCVQAFWFGMLHMNIVQGTYAFAIGLAFGYLADRFKSVVPSIIGHMIFNGFSCFVWPLFEIPESYVVYTVGAVIGAVIVAAGLYMDKKDEDKIAVAA